MNQTFSAAIEALRLMKSPPPEKSAGKKLLWNLCGMINFGGGGQAKSWLRILAGRIDLPLNASPWIEEDLKDLKKLYESEIADKILDARWKN
ncbi:hypothetical protein Pint_04588 [Pistacia integerrima]|uniref:Uncharacterized protein n=1 Tax=Pistacia integerrima TaxID=434235 RepID=A0ACC0Z332_9ROSI|nr:hypothetical protein Pint_04588 [Pistacia integerrima]